MVDELVIRAALRDELSRPIEGIRRDVRGLARDVDRVDGAGRRADRSTRTWGIGLGRLRSPLSTATRMTGGLLRNMRLVGGVGAAAVIAGIYKVGSAYSTQLNVFQGVTRATTAQMAAVRVEAKKLGTDLNLPATSAADAAAAMTELAKGGLSVRDSMLAAHGTLQLAAAAGVDGAVAAQIQANALNQFRLRGDQAGRVADVLANAANAASGEVTDVALALSYVGPVAAGMKVSITDTATAIGLLAKNGILAEKAGTGLRAMIGSLANPSKKAKAALRQLGITAFDNQGKFVGFRSLIDQLADAQGRLNDKQFTGAAAAAFGREPLAALIALANEGTTGFDAMSKAVGRQGGAADVAAARNKGFKGALDGLKSTIEGIGIEIYEGAEPALARWTRSAAEKLPTVVQRFKDVYTAATDGSGEDSFLFALSRAVTGDGTKLLGPLRTIADVLRDLRDVGGSAGTILGRDVAPPLIALAAVAFGGLLLGLEGIRRFLGFVADHPEVGAVLWGIVAATVAYKAAVGAQALLNGLSFMLAGFKILRASQGTLAALRALTGAQWLLNAAMAANPVGLVVAALVGLGVGLYLLWTRSETFRKIVIAVVREVAQAWLWMADKVLWALQKLFQAMGHLPGMAGAAARKAAGDIQGLRDNIVKMRAELDNLGKPVTIPINVQLNGEARAVFASTKKRTGSSLAAARAEGVTRKLGDTRRSMVAGGNLGRTMAFHARHASPGIKVSNALIGGGGLGYGSGDHQNGRALDLVGPGLPSYRARARAEGAFAEFHGRGPERHLHMAVGDTRTSQAGGGGGDAPPALLFAPQVTVQVTNAVPSEVDVSAASARGVMAAGKALAAYGYVPVPGGRGGRSS